MIKRILVPLDPSPFSESALRLACIIAKEYQAEITGLVILDIPGIEDSIGPIPLGGIHFAEKLEKEKTEEAKAHIQSLLLKFKKTCKTHGVSYKEAERQGSPSKIILDESIFYDMVFIGLRTYFHFETSEESGSSLDLLIKESVVPIYGVPAELPFLEKPDRRIRVLIAFDGSPLAARAMHRFAHLAIPDLYEITLLNVSEDQAQSMALLSRAEDYLRAHGITHITKDWLDGDLKEIVRIKYYDKMDGFVVGAHSRKGIFDFLVGSLTKYLLKEAKKPVLIG